jgi:ABC-type lipopolysaccharide export system ATPase subunit
MNVYNTLWITITLQNVSETLQISWKKYLINANQLKNYMINNLAIH